MLSLLILAASAGGFLGSFAALSLDRWIVRRRHRALLERLAARPRRAGPPVPIAVAEEDLEPGDPVVIDLANKTARRAK